MLGTAERLALGPRAAAALLAAYLKRHGEGVSPVAHPVAAFAGRDRHVERRILDLSRERQAVAPGEALDLDRRAVDVLGRLVDQLVAARLAAPERLVAKEADRLARADPGIRSGILVIARRSAGGVGRTSCLVGRRVGGLLGTASGERECQHEGGEERARRGHRGKLRRARRQVPVSGTPLPGGHSSYRGNRDARCCLGSPFSPWYPPDC